MRIQVIPANPEQEDKFTVLNLPRLFSNLHTIRQTMVTMTTLCQQRHQGLSHTSDTLLPMSVGATEQTPEQRRENPLLAK